MQCDKRVYSIRRATSVKGGEGMWCEQKVFSIRNVTSAVRVEKVCITRKVASAVLGKTYAV